MNSVKGTSNNSVWIALLTKIVENKTRCEANSKAISKQWNAVIDDFGRNPKDTGHIVR